MKKTPIISIIVLVLLGILLYLRLMEMERCDCRLAGPGFPRSAISAADSAVAALPAVLLLLGGFLCEQGRRLGHGPDPGSGCRGDRCVPLVAALYPRPVHGAPAAPLLGDAGLPGCVCRPGLRDQLPAVWHRLFDIRHPVLPGTAGAGCRPHRCLGDRVPGPLGSAGDQYLMGEWF